MIVTLKGIILNCNDALLELFDLSRTEFINHNLFTICSTKNITPPFDTLNNQSGQKNQTTITIKKHNLDLVKTIQWSATAIEQDINKGSILLLGFDITHFVASSAQQEHIKKSIMDHIPNHYIFWKDTHSVYLGCNQALASAVGLKSEADIIGKTDYDLPTTTEQSDAYRADDKLVMERGVPKLNIEEYQTLADGQTRVLSTSKIPLIDEQGNTNGVLAIYSDITERKNLELSLEKAKNMAETASRAKSEFIANMSHDIRTPLNGVVGMSQLLINSLHNPEQKQFAQWLNESGKQLLSLLNSILDIISADNINENDLHEETFDLHQCIQDIIKLELPTTKLKALDLQTNISNSVPQYIISDRTKLHRILLNLLGNAIKFTPKGHVAIEVILLAAHSDRVQLQFRVVDTGIGIPDEHHNKVFDRFFRSTSSYKGVYGRHGVGLHIAQSYVKLLGGDIKLTSKVGMGTTFYFDLSLKIGDAKEVKEEPGSDNKLPKAQSKNPIIPIAAKIFSPDLPHVLLIEDDKIALHLVELFASNAGCRFTSSIDGEHALKLAKTENFDLIITDMRLPGISGHQLTRLIREWEISSDKNPVPIIGLTAHMKNEDKEKCLKSGMNQIFTKPISTDLISIIFNQFINTPKKINSQSIEMPPTNSTTILGQDLPDTEQALFDLEQFPLLDAHSAIKNLGNEKLLRNMLQMMAAQELPKDKIAMEEAYAELNWEKIERIAHKMKGGAVYIGTVRVKFACQYLERYHKSGYSSLLKPLYLQLLQVIKETQQSIEHWLQH